MTTVAHTPFSTPHDYPDVPDQEPAPGVTWVLPSDVYGAARDAVLGELRDRYEGTLINRMPNDQARAQLDEDASGVTDAVLTALAASGFLTPMGGVDHDRRR